MSETVQACPHCNVAGHFYERGEGNVHAGDIDKPFYCWGCKRGFDSPIERPRKARPKCPPGVNAKYRLDLLDPDVIGGESDA